MKDKTLIFFLYTTIILLASSSTVAVPSSRSLFLKPISNKIEVTTNQRNLFHEFQQHKRERRDIEVADYSGTGANNHHDPRAPPGTY